MDEVALPGSNFGYLVRLEGKKSPDFIGFFEVGARGGN
jgi:hypothetical protein